MADATATVLMPALIGALLPAATRAATCASLPLASRDPRPQLDHGSADVALGFFPDVAAALAAEGAARDARRSSRSTPASTSA